MRRIPSMYAPPHHLNFLDGIHALALTMALTPALVLSLVLVNALTVNMEGAVYCS
jgi:hypothetical protein